MSCVIAFSSRVMVFSTRVIVFLHPNFKARKRRPYSATIYQYWFGDNRFGSSWHTFRLTLKSCSETKITIQDWKIARGQRLNEHPELCYSICYNVFVLNDQKVYRALHVMFVNCRYVYLSICLLFNGALSNTRYMTMVRRHSCVNQSVRKLTAWASIYSIKTRWHLLTTSASLNTRPHLPPLHTSVGWRPILTWVWWYPSG